MEIGEIIPMYKEDIIMVSNRWENLTRSIIQGIMDNREFDIERNKINSSVLALLTKIEKYISSDLAEHVKILEKQLNAELEVLKKIVYARINSMKSFATSILAGHGYLAKKFNENLSPIDTGECSEEFRKEFIELRRVLETAYEETKRLDSWNPLMIIFGTVRLLSGTADSIDDKIKERLLNMQDIMLKKSNLIEEEKGSKSNA